MNPQEIIDFWFGEECRQCWFNASAELDSTIKQKYQSWWEAAARGELDAWREAPLPALALVIILDQFPLNMFRGQPAAFATEAASRETARHAIAQGFDRELNKDQKLFMYLPFMHSEELQDQDRSVALFTNGGLETRWAEHHRDIVRRFGRFPHRNAILGRQSTAEEIEWLNSDEAFKG